jgi:protein O-mannosyl-transferase
MLTKPHAQSSRADAPPPSPWLYGAIFAVTLVAYLPALRAGFIWDDHPGHVTRPELQSLAGLGRIWFEFGATQQYYPLLHSAFWLEHRLWGDAAFGYHLVNVLLHATAACLVFRLLRKLAVPGAPLAALLFALHPVCVESVAWISEQKNTLSAVLYLCAALAYLRYDETRARSRHVFATIWFVLALLTKTVTATLPAALLVITWWRRGRIDWRRDVLPLVPWFMLSLAAGIITASFEHNQIGAQGADFDLGPIERGLLATRALCFYFTKLLWPAPLIFIYPRWNIDPTVAWQWTFPIVVLGVVAGLWVWRKKNRGPLAAALLFAGTLFPALGFVNVFPFIFSFVADHFQYLASIAIFALAAAGAERWLSRFGVWSTRAACFFVLSLLAALTWGQAETYRDAFTLYRTTLAQNPNCWMAHNNLAIALVDAREMEQAIAHYEKAIAQRPNYAEAENNLGYVLTQVKRHAEALPHLERALKLQPRYAEARNNLGIALMGLGRASEGIAAFTEAIRLKPNYAVAEVNLGLALARNGRPGEALPHFKRGAQLDPNYADAELNWGIALVVGNKIAEALPHFERALRLNPNSAEIHDAYGRALAALGRYDEAERHQREAETLGGQRR